jgi:hypothetical protein
MISSIEMGSVPIIIGGIGFAPIEPVGQCRDGAVKPTIRQVDGAEHRQAFVDTTARFA